MDLSSLLSETLTTQGYEVENAPPLEGRSGATYPVSLLANEDGETLLVDVLTSRPVTRRDVDALSSIVDDTGLDGAILFALDGVDDESTADNPLVEVWDRPAAVDAIGSLILDRALDGTLNLDDFEAKTIDAAREPTRTVSSNGDEPAEDPVPPADGDAELLDPTATPPPTQNARAQGQTEGGAPDPAPEPSGPAPAATANVEASSQSDAPGDVGDQERFVSPEEMAKRAKQMLDQGEIPDDGDAELLVEEDAPADAPAPAEPVPPDIQQAPETEATPKRAREATTASSPESPAPDAAPTKPQIEEGQVFEDGDCELLPSKPRSQPTDEQDTPADQDAGSPAPAGGGRPQPDPGSGQASPAQPDAATAPAPENGGAPASPAAVAGPPTEEEEPFLSGAVIDPRVDEDEARRAAEGALFQVHETRLELLPFHVFAYQCTLEGDGTTRGREGRAWVSAQSGGVVEAPDGDLVENLETPHERFQPRLEPSRTHRRAHDHLLDHLEVRDEMREDYSESAVIERVTLKPRESSLQLDHLGLAFAPRWRIEGQNGTVFVDALTGDLVTE